MKTIIAISFVLFTFSASAQNYEDSTITLMLTQRTTYWVGQYVKTKFEWSERNAPTLLKDYVGSGEAPDSLIASVQIKAKYLLGALESLISQPLQVAYSDYRAIVLNQPAVSGYVSLTTQINNKANGNGAEKNVAVWLKNKFAERTAAYDALYTEQKTKVVEWSRF